MNARIGDLAIARFYDSTQVCVVTGRYKNEMKFVYWVNHGGGKIGITSSLNKNYVCRVRPKHNPCTPWDGNIASLKVDDVEMV